MFLFLIHYDGVRFRQKGFVSQILVSPTEGGYDTMSVVFSTTQEDCTRYEAVVFFLNYTELLQHQLYFYFSINWKVRWFI